MSMHESNNDIFTDFDSRWELRSEFLNDLKPLDLENMVPDGKSGGVPLYSDGQTAYVDSSDSHCLVIGSTGSKKTRLIAMPTLQILTRAGESFIATDPKGELYDRTHEILTKNDYEILLINLRNPTTGSCWNPLYLPYELFKSNDSVKRDKSRELLDDLVRNVIPITNDKDPFWESSAQDFLLGLLELLFNKSSNENEINLRSVCLLRAQAMAKGLIKENYYDTIKKDSFEYICLSGTIEAPEKTQSSILSVFDQHMRIFSSQDALIQLLSSNDINFSKLGNKKTALFLIMPDEKTTYHKLISVFIKQCYEQLILEAQNKKDKALPVRVNFILDEFSSLPTIADFPAMITAARSRNMRFNLIVQSEHQLKARYGEEAQTIKGNCNNWLFLTSRETSLLEEISLLAGEKTKGIPLISISKLQRLDKNRGQVLIFHGRSYPYVSTLADISKYSGYKKEMAIYDLEPRANKDLIFFDFVAINDKIEEENRRQSRELYERMNKEKEKATFKPDKEFEKNYQSKNYEDIFGDSKSKLIENELKFNIHIPEEIEPVIIIKKFIFPSLNEEEYEFALIKRNNKVFLTDQGKTYKRLDKIFELGERDVIKNLVAILKQYGAKKIGNEFVIEVDFWKDDIDIETSNELNSIKYRLFSCVSFMLNMKIFYT
jgi:type IV secretion system protein VirD4